MFACCITRLLTNQPTNQPVNQPTQIVIVVVLSFYSTCAMCIYEWNIFAWRSGFSVLFFIACFSLLLLLPYHFFLSFPIFFKKNSFLFEFIFLSLRCHSCSSLLARLQHTECTEYMHTKLIHFRIIINWKPNQIGTVHKPMYFLYGNSDKLLSEKANRLHCARALKTEYTDDKVGMRLISV